MLKEEVKICFCRGWCWSFEGAVTGCARLNLSRVVGLFGFMYKVCYFLFNGVVYLFVDGELRFEPSSFRLPTLPFQLTELLGNTAEPGRRLLCTDCATAERGVLVKDRTEMVIVVTDRTDLWDSVREILFKGAGVNLFEASVRSFRFLYGYRYIKFAQDGCVVRWCSFVEMRMLSLCLENTKSSRWPWLWVGSETDWVRLNMSMISCSFLELLFSTFSKWKLKSPIMSVLPGRLSRVFKEIGKLIEKHGVREFVLFAGWRAVDTKQVG